MILSFNKVTKVFLTQDDICRTRVQITNLKAPHKKKGGVASFGKNPDKSVSQTYII